MDIDAYAVHERIRAYSRLLIVHGQRSRKERDAEEKEEGQEFHATILAMSIG
jgi:hypothetical protein